MANEQSRQAAERFQMALSLYELAEEMLRQKVRRQHPDASSDEIDRLVIEWWMRRPGAEHGDGPGQKIAWPRTRE